MGIIFACGSTYENKVGGYILNDRMKNNKKTSLPDGIPIYMANVGPIKKAISITKGSGCNNYNSNRQ